MVLVEHSTRPVDVDVRAAPLAPRQACHPLEIRVDHAVLGRGRRNAGEPAQLALRLTPGFVREAGLRDPATEVGHVAVAPLGFSELLLDGPELLAQVVLPLLLGQPLLGVGRDLPSQLPHGELALQQVDEPPELGGDRIRFENLLPGRHVEGDDRCDEVRDVARIAEILRRGRELVGELGRRLHEPAEDVQDRAAQGIHFGALDHLLPGDLDARDRVGLHADPVEHPDALDSLDQHTHAAIGHPSELADHARGSHTVEVGRAGRLRVRVALGHHGQQPVAAHDVVDELHRARLGNGDRDRRQRKDDRVPERQDG